MKKLLILMIVAMLLGSAAGCGICNWWRRGPAYQQCPPVVVSNPCPTVSTCDPCAGAPAISPGPETYAPVAR